MTPDQEARTKLESMLEQLNIIASVHDVRTFDDVQVYFGRGVKRTYKKLPQEPVDDWQPGDLVPYVLQEILREVDNELADPKGLTARWRRVAPPENRR